MKRLLLAFVMLMLAHSTARATWSVIAIDTKTGQVVPCDGKTAHVAYIAIANKDDVVGVTTIGNTSHTSA
jgi:hypothetical protein